MKQEKISPKVEALFRAVGDLIEEGVDINVIKVSDITQRAGIGKGTAYEYFSNKEEIIASAMVYQVNAICAQIETEIMKLEHFSSIISYIMDCMEREIQKRDCVIKYIHIMTDNGIISKILKQMIGKRDETICMPEDLLQKIIMLGIENGEIRNTLPLDYMCMTVAAKLMVYAIYLADEQKEGRSGIEEMHKMVQSSLLKEFN